MEVSKILQDLVDLENGHIFYGFVTDESMGDDIHVTVIATGLTVDDEPKIKPAQAVEAIRENAQQVHGGQGASSQSHPYAHQAAPMKMQAQSQTVMDFLNKQAKPS